jgi:hypothetical protein
MGRKIPGEPGFFRRTIGLFSLEGKSKWKCQIGPPYPKMESRGMRRTFPQTGKSGSHPIEVTRRVDLEIALGLGDRRSAACQESNPASLC